MIFIDYRSRVPIYEQIKEQVIMLVNTGVYSPGDKLPSIRSLGAELNVNVNTIKRAFSDLENDGIICSAQGRGVFISQNPMANERIKKEALADVERAVMSAKAKGASAQEISAAIKKIYREGESND